MISLYENLAAIVFWAPLVFGLMLAWSGAGLLIETGLVFTPRSLQRRLDDATRWPNLFPAPRLVWGLAALRVCLAIGIVAAEVLLLNAWLG